jgi:DNA-binding response OmpR family regulator
MRIEAMASKGHILLVDDDEELRQTLAEQLKHAGYQVTEAGNGDLGQFSALLADFDLILSDVRMPFVDGIAMSKFIQERSHTPVILMTGHLDDNIRKRAAEIRAGALLTKPFRIKDLLEAVAAVLQKSKPKPHAA